MANESSRSASGHRAVVAARSQVLLLGLAALLRERGWKVEAVAPSDAAAACRRSQAALLVIDVAMMDDVKIAAAAKKAIKSIRVMAVIGERNPFLVRELQAAGAGVIVHHATAAAEAEKALAAALAGHDFLCPLCREDLASAGKRRGLSPRETEVLRLLGYGNTNKIVAEQLKISEKTVEAHRANIKRKLGARGLSDLVRYAISTGLVDTKDPIRPE